MLRISVCTLSSDGSKTRSSCRCLWIGQISYNAVSGVDGNQEYPWVSSDLSILQQGVLNTPVWVGGCRTWGDSPPYAWMHLRMRADAWISSEGGSAN